MEFIIIALVGGIWIWREFAKSAKLWQIERDVEELRIWTERKDSQLIKIHADLNNLAHRIVEEQRLYAQKPEEKSGVIRGSGEKLNNDFLTAIAYSLRAEAKKNAGLDFCDDYKKGCDLGEEDGCNSFNDFCK